ncbi:Di-N-acetylchitobiase [Chlorella vulgaris]
MWLWAVALLAYAAIAAAPNRARASQTCPCSSPALCQPISVTHAREVFGFTHAAGARVVIDGRSANPAAVYGNRTARAAWVAEQVQHAVEAHLDGINFDLEAPILPGDPLALEYSALVAEAAAAFHTAIPGSQVSVDVPWSPYGVDDRHYDWAGLAEAADLLFIWGRCVASANSPLALVRRGLQQWLQLGAPRSKLVLGLPYGYKYPCVNPGFAGQHDLCELSPVPFFGAPCSDAAGQQVCFCDIAAMTSAAGGDSHSPSSKVTGTGAVGSRALSATQPGKWIIEQQHSLHHPQQLEVEVEQGRDAALACHVRYDAQQESVYANCRRASDAADSYSHQIWFDDPASIRLKCQLATELGLRGVGVWNLDCLDYQCVDPACSHATTAMWAALQAFQTPVTPAHQTPEAQHYSAITKKNGPSSKGDVKGTLTAMWASAGSKVGTSVAPPAQAAPPAADVEPQASFGRQCTPEGARPNSALAAEAAAGRTTGGDVAIGAAPDPSPEPAAALTIAVIASEQPDAAGDAALAKASNTVDKADKKRKRSTAAEPFKEDQLTKLQALFAENEYANTAAKSALASELGVELVQVNKWFEKERKRARDAGAAPKRGRPKSGAANDAETVAATDTAAALTGQENVAPAAQAVGAGAALAPAEEAMEVDAQPPVQATPPQEQQSAAVPEAPVPGAARAVQATPAEAEAAPGVLPPPSAAQITPAPAPQPPEAAAGAAAGADAAAVPPMALPGAVCPAPASAAAPDAAVAAAKTPASAATQLVLSADSRHKLQAELQAEAGVLRRQGLAPPLRPLPAEPPAERLAFSDTLLAAHVAGQQVPLSQLVAALQPLFKVPDSEAAVEEAVVSSHIVDLATRKSYAPKEGAGAAIVDVLEDAAPERLWQWELRDPKKSLAKELRLAAQQAKRRGARVQDRLAALSAALRLLEAHKEGKATARLSKALDSLHRVKTLAQIEEEQKAERDAAAAKEAPKKLQSAGKTEPSAEEKARLKAEKEAEKELARAAKEAEKERLKLEKEAEKERLKAEKERSRQEAEEARLAKKAGLKSVGSLQKQKSKFFAFFQQPQPVPGSTLGAAAAGSPGPCAATPACRGPSSRQGGSQAGAGSSSPTEAATTGKKILGYDELFPKLQGPNLRSLAPQPCMAAAMDAGSCQPFTNGQAQAEWQQLLSDMKRRRREAAAQPRLLGLPPSWARKPNAFELAQQHMDKLQQSGADLAAVRTWRRKLIFFPADSQRPAYHGSSKLSDVVRPRRFLARDEALDYEAMSDQEWEAEPVEGSSLTGADEEESEMGCGDDDDGSFICSDGHLSENEGVQLDDLELEGDDMQVDGPQSLPEDAAAAAGVTAQRLLSMQQLEVQMDRARRAGKPLIISRLPGDPLLLAALAAEPLVPGARVTVPEDPALEQAAAGTAAAAAAKDSSPAGAAGAAVAATAGGAGRPTAGTGGRRAERPDDLLPDLLRLVQADPRQNKAKITDAFIAAHSGRKVTKKWVGDMLKDSAEWKGTVNGWALKPAALQLLDPSAGALAAAAALASGSTPLAPVAAQAAAAAAVGCGAGLAAASAAPHSVAEAASSPHFGATRHTDGSSIARFFNFKSGKDCDAAPSMPCSGAPPSDLKAPGRLVTTTATAGAAAAASQLLVPESVSGTADPFWRCLLQHIECAEDTDVRPAFLVAFEPAALARLVSNLPAGIVAALVAGVAADMTPAGVKAAYLECLRASVAALAAMEAEAAGDNLSASQQVWQPRGAPVAASLAGLCSEPQLLSGLQACVEAGHAAGNSCATGGAQLVAAQSAAYVAAALLDSEVCVAALGATLEAGGAEGPREQLSAIVQACKRLGITIRV